MIQLSQNYYLMCNESSLLTINNTLNGTLHILIKLGSSKLYT